MSKNNAKKILKNIKKACPQCGEENSLSLVIHEKNEGGVIYSEEYIECSECGYKEKRKNKRDNFKLEFE